MPALPLDDAGPYVAAAYVLFVVLLVVYVGIMSAKLGRITRELDELTEADRARAETPTPDPAPERDPGGEPTSVR